jgi:hypothetical protein
MWHSSLERNTNRWCAASTIGGAARGCQGPGKGSTGFYETLRKDHKLRDLSGGLFKKSKNSFSARLHLKYSEKTPQNGLPRRPLAAPNAFGSAHRPPFTPWTAKKPRGRRWQPHRQER